MLHTSNTHTDMAISVKFIKNATSAQIAVTAGVGDTGKLQIQFNGADIYNNLAGSFNDISAGALGVTQPIALALDATGNIPQGVYYVNFVASAGVSATSTVNFVTHPFVPCLESTYDCYTPNFYVEDKTNYSSIGSVDSASRSLTLTYPAGSVASPILVSAANTTSKLYIDTGVLWTGSMQSTMSYDVTYSIAAIGSSAAYTYQQVGSAYDVQVVECDSALCDIYCCIEGLRKKVVGAQSKNRSYYAELLSTYSYVGALMTQYREAASCKKYEDLPKIYEQIKLAAGCEDCNCGCGSEETEQVLGFANSPFLPVVNNYAQAVVSQVRNSTGATIDAGSVVYINGATGSLPTIAKAQANSEATSSKTFGVVLTSISNNSNGFVVVLGLVNNIDTSAFADGALLWLSAVTPGAFTATKPVQPLNSVFIGVVTRSSNNGSIEVNIHNGYELDELHNVLITTPANSDLLAYETSTGLWKNTKTFAGTHTFGTLAATNVNAANGVFGEIRVDSPTLHVDSANDRIGFGTTSPTRNNDFFSSVRFRGTVYDEADTAGASGSLMTTTGTAVRWQTKADLGIPSTTSATTNRIPFFSDGPNNILSGNTRFIAASDGLSFSVGTTSLALGVYSLAVANTLQLFGGAPVLKFSHNSYGTDNHYTFQAVSGTGSNPGVFSLIRTIAGVPGTVFDFSPSGVTRFYSQFVATTLSTDAVNYWQLGRHIAASLTPTGNYIEVTVNGTAYKLATVA